MSHSQTTRAQFAQPAHLRVHACGKAAPLLLDVAPHVIGFAIRHERNRLRQGVDSAVPAVALAARCGEGADTRKMLLATGKRDAAAAPGRLIG